MKQPVSAEAFQMNEVYFDCINNETESAVPRWRINGMLKTKRSLNHMKFTFADGRLTVYDITICDNNTSFQCVYLIGNKDISSDTAYIHVVAGRLLPLAI